VNPTRQECFQGMGVVADYQTAGIGKLPEEFGEAL
jgi:hypothetical protein